MNNKQVLIPLPSKGCDPSEVGIPWKLITEAGIDIVFATPTGAKAETDPIMLTGKGLGVFKLVLAARKDAKEAYMDTEKSKAFCNPISYEEIREEEFDAIYLPGGHDKPVREYLESAILQQTIVDFFNADKTVGAICHGVVLVARSIDSITGKSVINTYNTTSLLNKQELMGFTMTRIWMKDYYLTYPKLTVEDEVRAALKEPNNFLMGPTPILRDTLQKLSRGFFVRDRNYISARWPGDLYNFTQELIK